MAVLCLHCSTGFSLIVARGSNSPIAVRGFLIAVASPVVDGALALGHKGFSSCDSWALEHRLRSCGTWASAAPQHVGSSGTRG